MHCNTLQYTAMHCNTLESTKHSTALSYTMNCMALHCNVVLICTELYIQLHCTKHCIKNCTRRFTSPNTTLHYTKDCSIASDSLVSVVLPQAPHGPDAQTLCLPQPQPQPRPWCSYKGCSILHLLLDHMAESGNVLGMYLYIWIEKSFLQITISRWRKFISWSLFHWLNLIYFSPCTFFGHKKSFSPYYLKKTSRIPSSEDDLQIAVIWRRPPDCHHLKTTSRLPPSEDDLQIAIIWRRPPEGLPGRHHLLPGGGAACRDTGSAGKKPETWVGPVSHVGGDKTHLRSGRFLRRKIWDTWEKRISNLLCLLKGIKWDTDL